MKKFYVCMGAALVAASAIANTATPPPQKASKPGDYIAAFSDVLGYYDWEYLPDDWSATVTKSVTIKAGEGLDDLIFCGLWEDSEIAATYDPEFGLITIPDQPVTADGSVWVRSFNYNNFTMEWTPTPDKPYQCFTIPQGLMFEDFEQNLAFCDAEGKLLLGILNGVWFQLINMDEEFWTLFDDNATFTDGWAAGKYTNETINPYKVKVLQNKENKNLFAIVDPYGGEFPKKADNLDTDAHGYIVFDVEDPDCVRVKHRVYSGLTTKVMMENSQGIIEEREIAFYNYNAEENLCFSMGKTPAQAADQLRAQGFDVSYAIDNKVGFENCLIGTQYNRYSDSTFGNEGGMLVCSKNIVGTTPPAPNPDLFVCGTIFPEEENGLWTQVDANKMTEADGVYTYTHQFSAGEWKIAGNQWNPQFFTSEPVAAVDTEYAVVDAGSANQKWELEDGLYKIIFNYTAKTLKVEKVENSIGIIEANEELPAVYYNLQGVRVNNPEVGHVYIERRGSSARKIVR